MLPVGISLAFLVVLWGSVLFPHCVGGMLDNLEVDGHLHVSLDFGAATRRRRGAGQ